MYPFWLNDPQKNMNQLFNKLFDKYNELTKATGQEFPGIFNEVQNLNAKYHEALKLASGAMPELSSAIDRICNIKGPERLALYLRFQFLLLDIAFIEDGGLETLPIAKRDWFNPRRVEEDESDEDNRQPDDAGKQEKAPPAN